MSHPMGKNSTVSLFGSRKKKCALRESHCLVFFDSRYARMCPPRGARSAISTPLWEISTPHWTSHIPHVCPGGVLPTMRQGLYCMAWSSNPMEASPLGLRSVTVLPRALLEVSPDPPVGRRRQQTTNNNPACINSPL